MKLTKKVLSLACMISCLFSQHFLWGRDINTREIYTGEVYEKSIKVRSELIFNFPDKESLFQNRILLDCSLFRLLYIDIREEIHYYRFGFACPWVTFGPGMLKGLLAEINNPLGYSACSNILYDKAALALDISIKKNNRLGGFFSPFPDYMTLFFYKSQGDVIKWGGYVRIPVKNRFFIEGVFLHTEPETKEVDTWYIKERLYPGGKYCVGAFKLKIAFPSIKWMGTLALSCGPMLKPGIFLHTGLRIKIEKLEVKSYFGLSEGCYFKPDGKACTKWIVSDTLIWFPFFLNIRLGGRFKLQLDHRPIYPSPLRSSVKEAAALLEADFKITEWLNFIWESCMKSQWERDCFNLKDNKFTVKNEAAFKWKELKWGLEHQWKEKVHSLKIIFSLYGERVELEFYLKKSLKNSLSPDFCINVTYKSELQNIFIKMKKEEDDYTFSIGCTFCIE
jgi:hypothetical protein